MKYILKNIYLFYKNERMIFILTIFCILISTIAINFSYGLYCDFEDRRLAEIDELRHLQIGLADDLENDKYITKEDLDNCFLQFPDDLENAIDLIFVTAEVDDNLLLECRFTVRNGKYAACKNFQDNLRKFKFSDVYFTDSQEANGELVALYPDLEDNKYELPQNKNESMEMQGKTYKIIGYQYWSYFPLVPFSSLDKETKIIAKDGLVISFSKAITREQYEELQGLLTQNLGNRVSLPSLAIPDNQKMTMINTILLIAILIAIIASLNFSVLYKFILIQREKSLLIYRICGLDKFRAVGMYVSECVMILIPVYFLGVIIYHFGLLPLLKKIYPGMTNIYSVKNYSYLLCIFLFISLLILIVNVSRFVFQKPIYRTLKG